VVIISVDGNELEKITVEDDTSSDQLNVMGRRVVVCVNSDDLDTGLEIGLHEATSADVEEDLVQIGGNVTVWIGRKRSGVFLNSRTG
jgi:hypothetical protein